MSGLPTLVVIGAAKTGTTSLARWLRGHPEVHVAPEKEVHFFEDDSNWQRGQEWYASRFAEHCDRPVLCDATPTYMVYPEAIARMARTVPEARLIALLRDPVQRAYSNWRHVYYRDAITKDSFAQIMDRELVENAGLPARGRCDPAESRYLTQGLYMDQLSVVLEHYPREQLLVLLTDDLERDPVGTFRTVCRFAGIDDEFVPDVVGERVNTHTEWHPVWLWRFFRKHRVLARLPDRVAIFIARTFMRRIVPPDPIDPAIRARLAEYFAEPNHRLAAFVGRDLSAWETGQPVPPPPGAPPPTPRRQLVPR